MADVLFILLVVAFFGVAILVISACDRIAGVADGQGTDSEVRDAR